MSVDYPARRVSVDMHDPDSLAIGDYCGPIVGFTGDKPAVFYRLPPRGELGHVCSPPHTFRECPDGSLEIRNSIGHARTQHGYQWHGWLDEGNVWRDVSLA